MAAPHGAVRQHRASPSPARAQSPATGAPRGGLACPVGRVQPPAEAPPGPGPRPTLPRRPAHDSAAVPASMLLGPSTEPPGDGAGPHGTRLDPVVTAARRTEVSPIATTRRTRDETAATGRTDRHQTAGRRTGWTPAGRTAASGRGSQITGHWTGWTPDGWTPGPRTVGRVGWTPNSGHRLAMDSRQASWHPDHCDEDPTAGMLSRSSAGQTPRGPIRNQDSSAVEGPAGSWPPPRQTAVGDPPPSGRRLGALLSCVGVGGYEERAMGLRKVGCAGSGW
jgi:hypothetical protein